MPLKNLSGLSARPVLLMLFCTVLLLGNPSCSGPEQDVPANNAGTPTDTPRAASENLPLPEASEMLFESINAGDLEAVKLQIENRPELLSATHIEGKTALHQAAFAGHLEMVKWLTAKGADINARTDYGWTPLFFSIAPMDESCGLYLLESGAEATARSQDDGTSLHVAACFGKTKIAVALLENGADINAVKQNGDTPLDVAVTTRSKVMVEFLEKRDAKTGKSEEEEEEEEVETPDQNEDAESKRGDPDEDREDQTGSPYTYSGERPAMSFDDFGNVCGSRSDKRFRDDL